MIEKIKCRMAGFIGYSHISIFIFVISLIGFGLSFYVLGQQAPLIISWRDFPLSTELENKLLKRALLAMAVDATGISLLTSVVIFLFKLLYFACIAGKPDSDYRKEQKEFEKYEVNK